MVATRTGSPLTMPIARTDHSINAPEGGGTRPRIAVAIRLVRRDRPSA